MDGRTNRMYDFSDEEDYNQEEPPTKKLKTGKRKCSQIHEETGDHFDGSNGQDVKDSCETEPYSLEAQDSFDERSSYFPTSPNNVSNKHKSDSPGAPGTSVKSTLRRIVSVARDAENIAAVLGIVDVDLVYERVKQLRNRGNRTDIVTNEILENGINSLKRSDESPAKKSQDLVEELIEDIEEINAAVLEVYPNAQLDPDEVFTLLEKYEHRVERVDIVRDKLIKKIQTQSFTDAQLSSLRPVEHSEYLDEEDDLVTDLEKVLEMFPEADPNKVYKIINKHKTSTNRIVKVVSILRQEHFSEAAEGNSKKMTRTDLVKDPLYTDTNVVAALFPDKDKNEIYAYLEAHYHTKNRVQVVTDELLRMQQDSQQNSSAESQSATAENHQRQSSGVLIPRRCYGKKIRINDDISSSDREMHVKRSSKKGSKESNHTITASEECSQEELEVLLAVFPDCDPEYLRNGLTSLANDTDRVQKISNAMFEDESYPKLKDRQDREEREERLAKIHHGEFDMDDFLHTFPDPCDVFYSEKTAVSALYRKHCLIQLKNDFLNVREDYIQKLLTKHNEHYLPTHRELQTVATAHSQDFTICCDSARDPEPMPDNPDEYFYKELIFAIHEDKIKDHVSWLQLDKTQRREEARTLNKFYTCPCCFDDEILLEDTLSCPQGHTFCRECIRRSTEVNIGEAKVTFPCLSDECEVEFNVAVLQRVLSAKMFSILLRRVQEEELRKANIDGLVTCPFCSFATIMLSSEDRVLKCQNPECLKESCRLCREQNHIPLRCDEIEKSFEKGMRSYIEAKMTEAMIRSCWRCKKRFFKADGCNKITCSCGASMCYVCRKPIKDYEHFTDYAENSEDEATEALCPSDSNALYLHREEMEKAGREARIQYELDHPEVVGKILKFDPLDMVRKKVVLRKKPYIPPPTPKLFGIIPIPAFLRRRPEPPPEPEYVEVEVNPLEEYYYKGDLRYQKSIDNPDGSIDDAVSDDELQKAQEEFECSQSQ